MGLGVAGNEDLEAAVQKKALNFVSSDTAANGIGSFEEEEGDVLGVEVRGGSETGEASSDDDDTGSFGVRLWE